MPTSIELRPLQARDRRHWRALYRQYASFYATTLSDAQLDRTWSWLMDPHHPVQGIVAASAEQQLLGLAHFRASPEPLLAQEIAFLEDLFVAPGARGEGIGRRLVRAVADSALQRGWPLVRWVTADTNAQARALYDQLARLTHWVTYELDIER